MITHGHVMIEDGQKAAQEYAPARKVQVHIGFHVPEGEDGEPHVTAAGDLAQAHVARLLGKPAPVAKAPVAAPVDAQTPAAAPATVAAKPAARKPKEKTKDDLAAEAGLPLTDTVQAGTAAAEPAEDPNDLGDILGETAKAPVTDLELNKAAQEKNGAMTKALGDKWAPDKIRKLVAEYNGNVAGKKLTDIPTAKRPAFLEALAALT